MSTNPQIKANPIKKGLIRTAVKAKFKKNFGFTEINNALLQADKLKDTLMISGEGYLINEVTPCRLDMPKVLKLSEHQDNVDSFLMDVSDEIEALEIHKAHLFFDYKINVLTMTVWYLNFNKEKCKEAFDVKF